jgi:hypothetical protein
LNDAAAREPRSTVNRGNAFRFRPVCASLLDTGGSRAKVGAVQEATRRCALKYIAEIESPSGETATKEYEAMSIREVVRRVKLDLGDYPGFHLLHVNAAAYPVGEMERSV